MIWNGSKKYYCPVNWLVFPRHKFDAEKQAVYRVVLDYYQIHKKNNDSLIQHGLILWYDHTIGVVSPLKRKNTWMIKNFFMCKNTSNKIIGSTYPPFSSDGTTFTASEVFLDSLATFFSLTSLVMPWTFCKQAYRKTNTMSQTHHFYWHWIQHDTYFVLLFYWIDWLAFWIEGLHFLLHKNGVQTLWLRLQNH